MNKKKLIGCFLAGVFSVGLIGGVGASGFATTTQENDKVKYPPDYLTDTITQERLQKIKDELHALRITLSDQLDKDLTNLDAETKEKLEEIAGKLKTKKLTSEEALEIRKLRINHPKQEKRAEKFMDIDAETKARAKEILEKAMTGSLTKDEAISELEKLGISLPNLDTLTHLDSSEAKAEAEAIYKRVEEGTITKEEAALEIRKLRIKPSSLGEQGK